MTYIHIDLESVQSPKQPGNPCGDVVLHERTAAWTTLILADGIGSGVKANLAAVMCGSRLMEMLRRGFSVREAFSSLVKTMNESRDPSLPFACFCVARVLNDGEATVLSYEMPPPLLVSPRHASVLPHRTFTLQSAILGEAACHLESGEGLMLVSDGITQAGLGAGLRDGWTIEGAADYVNSLLGEGVVLPALPLAVHDQARRLWRSAGGDDCTAVLGLSRKGVILNVMTGPPAETRDDDAQVARFLAQEGWHVVCGATTAKLVARYLGREVKVVQDVESLLAPPRYEIDGVHLVTEGAVTLNQVYNILGEDPSRYEEDSGVTQLCTLLAIADRVNFFVGTADNPANASIAYRQQGILGRAKIVPLIADRLRAEGKLVVVERV